jgi:hypothetical protein
MQAVVLLDAVRAFNGPGFVPGMASRGMQMPRQENDMTPDDLGNWSLALILLAMAIAALGGSVTLTLWMLRQWGGLGRRKSR